MESNLVTFSLLSSTAAVDMKTASVKVPLYTVPTGKTCVVTAIIVRSPTVSLAGGTSYSFGDTATATGWKSSVDLSSLTTVTTSAIVIMGTSKFAMSVAAAVFGMYITTGSTSASTATIDVYGYLF